MQPLGESRYKRDVPDGAVIKAFAVWVYRLLPGDGSRIAVRRNTYFAFALAFFGAGMAGPGRLPRA